MTSEHKKVFISYSWDDLSHEQWVMDLANKLRKKGVDAKIDKFVTQSGTIHLQEMMSRAMRTNDYILLILTEKYTEKADEIRGGVGFETLLTLPDLQKNPNKLVPIVKHQGNFDDAIPFHLRGYYAIDFSEEENFEEKFIELLHRIEGVPLYEEEPLGEKAELIPKRKIKPSSSSELFENIKLPQSQVVSDLDKSQFLSNSYDEMLRWFITLFSQIKEEIPGFEYTKEEFGSKKHSFKLYIDGRLKTGVKMWLGGNFSDSINLSYGGHINPYLDNSMNEIITYEVVNGKELRLRMTMNIFGNNKSNTPKDIVKEIWEQHLYQSIE